MIEPGSSLKLSDNSDMILVAQTRIENNSNHDIYSEEKKGGNDSDSQMY